MNSLNILALQLHRDAIVSDLVVPHIIDKLIAKLVINEEDKGLIDKENNDKDKARQLLDILANKTDNDYEAFREVLEYDYEWLAKLLVVNGASELFQTIQQDAITVGGVPRDPPYYVERTDILKTIRTGLINLDRSNFLLLHGMPGSGKSCLARSAICDCEVLNKMNNRVYWCSVGECTTTELIQQHLYRLYLKVQSDLVNRNNRPNSILMSEKLEHLHDSLRSLFTRIEFRDALLVLDDVLNSQTLDMFDIGCKILITSKNKEIFNKINDKDINIIDVKAFTEHESVQVFANCMNIKAESLSIPHLKNLKTIHNLCRGLPMVVALIGGQLKLSYSVEAARIERMEDCIRRLNNHDDFYKSNKTIFSVIDICVKDLPDELKQKFEDLVIFLEDVNVPTCVLQLLWNETKYSVEDIMTELKNRSLVLGQINPENREFVFGLHDLLHAYLKNRLSPTHIRNVHIKLIEAYRKKCNGDFSKLPNDNYIYSYLGYHFEEANQSLPDIYLDLNFIGAKIRATSAADLLVDLKKYGDKIINGNNLRKSQLNEMEEFVKSCGYNLYRYPDLCVIQLALTWKTTGYLKALALDIIKKQPERLFVDVWCKEKGPPHPQILDLNSVPVLARFAVDTNQILVACRDGTIEMWDLNYYRLRAKFEGHRDSVKFLTVSPTGENFVSISEKGESRLWTIPSSLSHSNSFANGTPNGSPSPIIKQKPWSSLYDTDASKFSSLHLFDFNAEEPFQFAGYSTDGEFVCLCSANGFLNIHNVATSQTVIIKNIEIENIISCCFYKKNYIMLGTSDNQIWLFNILNAEITSKFSCNQNAVQLLTNKFGEVLSITSTSIGYFKSQNIVELQNDILCSCANITPEGDILVIGNTETISIYEIKYDEYGYVEKLEILHFIEDISGKVMSVDIYQNGPYIYLLVTIKEEQVIKIWCLQPGDFSTDYNKTARILPVFDCIFDPMPMTPDGRDTMKSISQQLSNNNIGLQSLGTILNSYSPNSPRHDNVSYQLAVADTSSKLQIQRGHTVSFTNVNESNKITCISMSSCGLFIAYGLDNGYIFIHETKLGSNKKIMKLPESASYLEFINDITLVAADNLGSLMAWQKEFSIKLQDVKIQESKMEKRKDLRAEEIIKCFAYNHYIISVSKNFSMKLWCLENKEHKLVSVLWGNPSLSGRATCAKIHNHTLAVGDFDGYLSLYSLKNIKEQNTENFRALCLHKYDIGKPIICLDLSPDGSVIAVGLDNGDISVWSTTHNLEIKVLKLHKSSVNHLCFAPTMTGTTPMILLSTSDILAWWNVSYCLEKYTNILDQSKYKRRKSLNVLNQLRELDLKNIANPDKWANKKGPDWRVELMICIKLQGKHAFKAVYNNFFTSFVTIDDSGQFYLMKLK